MQAKAVLRMAAIAACFIAPTAQAATEFTFTLDDSYTTSAAVYDEWGYLMRTLTRGEHLTAGPHTITWDGRDDAGQDLHQYPSYDENGHAYPAIYQLKLLKHNIGYQWEGVIGNTSASFNGPDVFRSYLPPQSLTIGGDHLYFSMGYNENQMGSQGFKLSDPTRNEAPFVFRGDRANGRDPFARFATVTGDSARLYWTNTGGIVANSFVAVSELSTRNYGSFTNGHPLCLNYRASGPCYEDQNYLSVIDDAAADRALSATGIAVQVNGSMLAVAHGRQDQIRLFDKATGTLLKTLPISHGDIPASSPLNQLAMAPNGDLWVIEGTTLNRYTNLSGTPTLAASVSGFARPLSVTVHPADDDIVLVADGGASQQVKAMNRNGQPLWTYGQAGGYGSDPTVSNNKLWFRLAPALEDNPTGALREQTSLAIQPDGSFWVIDTANSRMLHIGADRQYLGQMAYLSASYSATVDPNNPQRVFSGFLEFQVDTASPLQPGENGSWTLVRNWLAGFPASLQDTTYWLSGLSTVTTLTNGRTYALNNVLNGDVQLVELPATGPARNTGTTMRAACPAAQSRPCVMYENGDLSYVTGPVISPQSNDQKVYRRSLSGFDPAGNPQWSTPSLLAGPVPAIPTNSSSRNTPYFHYAWTGITGPRFPVTGSNRVVFFDPTVNIASTVDRNDGLHLGAMSAGDTYWTWQASPTGALDGKGSFQTQANDGSVNYGGNLVWARGAHIVYGYHGEYYRDQVTHLQGEANQFMHFHEDGLFIGQFGVPNMLAPGAPADPGPGQAGNAFSNILVPAGPDAMYWYHNDESNHAGVHRWRIDNLSSAIILKGSGTLDSSIALH